MKSCFHNPGSKAELKLPTLSCSGCAALAIAEAAPAVPIEECKVLLPNKPQVHSEESTSTIDAATKDRAFRRAVWSQAPVAKMAELDAVMGVYKTEEEANRWMVALYSAGIEENVLTIKAGDVSPYEDRSGYIRARTRMWFWGKLGMLIGAA